MSATTHTTALTTERPPPKVAQGPWGWLRTRLFSTPLNTVLTILILWLLLMAVPALIDWLFIKPDFAATTAEACRATGGYCWAFVVEKHRLILFGIYPMTNSGAPCSPRPS